MIPERKAKEMTLTEEIAQLAQSTLPDSERLQVLIQLVARLSKAMDGIDEDHELLSDENDRLRKELGDVYGRAIQAKDDDLES